MKSNKYIEFALISPKLAGYGFNSYMDENGDVAYIVKGKTQYGQPIKKSYEFSQARRILRIPAHRTDEIEFLRNCPECEGSPLGSYDENGKQQRVYYREINEGKDASVMVDATKNRLKAQNLAIEISENPEKMKALSVVLGCFKEDPGLQLAHLIQYAETSPSDFIKTANGAELEASYLVKEALRKSVMTRKGYAVIFGELSFADEEDAVAKVMTDKDIKKSLEKQLKN